MRVTHIDWKPKADELAWAAGFFDAEGTTGLYKRKVRLAAKQVDPEVLERLRRALGVGRVYGPYRSPKGRPIFAYIAVGFQHVQAAVAMLWPWLSTPKRAQAAKALCAFRGVEPMPSDGTEKFRSGEGLSWAAGFFDGDGSVFASRRPDKVVNVTISISQTDREPLDRFASIVNCGKIYGPSTRAGRSHHRPFYMLGIEGFERTQATVARLWPWLSEIKREQAKRALEAFVSVWRPRYGERVCEIAS